MLSFSLVQELLTVGGKEERRAGRNEEGEESGPSGEIILLVSARYFHDNSLTKI